jgi:hypothetical protein
LQELEIIYWGGMLKFHGIQVIFVQNSLYLDFKGEHSWRANDSHLICFKFTLRDIKKLPCFILFWSCGVQRKIRCLDRDSNSHIRFFFLYTHWATESSCREDSCEIEFKPCVSSIQTLGRTSCTWIGYDSPAVPVDSVVQ